MHGPVDKESGKRDFSYFHSKKFGFEFDASWRETKSGVMHAALGWLRTRPLQCINLLQRLMHAGRTASKKL